MGLAQSGVYRLYASELGNMFFLMQEDSCFTHFGNKDGRLKHV
jgi:hypothetical protein